MVAPETTQNLTNDITTKHIGRFLVADIGGTNTRVALVENGDILHGSVRRYVNAQMPSLDEVLRRYLVGCDTPKIDRCCLAIAGPMLGNVVEVTNLGWLVDADEIGQVVGVQKVEMLNDLEALGYSLATLRPAQQHLLFSPSSPAPQNAPRLVIGLGTGFNTAILHRGPNGHQRVHAAETGHIGMPVRNAADLRLSQFGGRFDGFCALEDVLSGPGLETIYAWVCHEAGSKTTQQASDITRAMIKGEDPLAIATLHQFTAILGAALSDLALIHLPFGGLYLAGGVARHLAPLWSGGDLQAAFTDKGRKSDLMKAFELTLITDDFAPLTGCVNFLRQNPPYI